MDVVSQAVFGASWSQSGALRARRLVDAGLPEPENCDGCALATLYINQEVERRLRQEAHALLGHAEGAPEQQDVASPEEIDEI